MPETPEVRELLDRRADASRAERIRSHIGRTVDALSPDLRFSVRALSKSPGVTAVAALSLALGIGATTTIFAALDAAVLRSLPFPEPERLIVVEDVHLPRSASVNTDLATVRRYQEVSQSFESVALASFVGGTWNIPGPDGAERIWSQWVGGAGVSRVLGVAAAMSSTLLVSTVVDAQDGDVSSPDALRSNPGPDGAISLREAMAAASNGTGPQTIGFAAQLAGRTIRLTSALPVIARDQVAILGRTNRRGRPTITISAEMLSIPVFQVFASHFTLFGLRIEKIGGSGSGTGVFVRAGGVREQPRVIESIRVIGNEFSNEGAGKMSRGNAITIATENGSRRAVIRDVIIAHNTFSHFEDGVAIGTGTGGTRGRLENLSIHDNSFFFCAYAVELASGDKKGRVRNTEIIRNLFRGNVVPISIWTGSGDGSMVTNTVISGNTILDSQKPAIHVTAGVSGSRNSRVSNLRIVNNLIAGDGGMCLCFTGGDGSSRASGIGNVRVVNNTVVGEGTGLQIFANTDGATTNFVRNLKIVNTIFDRGGFFGEVFPSQVHNSITFDPGFAGVNGNIAADPRFVDPSRGNYRLRGDSPAVDAGTSKDAPEADFQCGRRGDSPDIGAYEYGSAPAARLTLATLGTGVGTIETDPVGFGCGSVFARGFERGTVVSLLHEAASGSAFVSWAGDNDCSDGRVTMGKDRSCFGIFDSQE